MPKYKLTYFNIRGRAEVSRYLFALKGTEYEDIRFEEDQWDSIKPTVKNPFLQLPYLEVDDELFVQTTAIESYLAATFGFHGNDNKERYIINMVNQAVDDIMTKLMTAVFEPDEERKSTLRGTYDKFLPTWLKAMETILQGNHSDYFVPNRLTLADLQFFCAGEYLLHENEKQFDDFPGLKGLYDRVASNKQIAEWRKKRPKTEH